MAVLDYVAPASVNEAVAVLKQHGQSARILAGGTDIIVQEREGRRNVGVMVDVKAIPELTGISLASDGSLKIGAAASCASIYRNAEVQKRFPALIDSASLIGGIQIQSRASLGGNLCNSSPAADSIPTLIALGAQCEIAGPGGRRTVAVEDFCTAPGRNVLGDGEMLVSLRFPAPAAKSGAA
ncbi:MAG TPA: FAD binding domain-containing protein, partial [Tepidiformaceae bacterium]|nr:FAD binding domain-containing protein [Tepidiformaceae bacterium]